MVQVIDGPMVSRATELKPNTVQGSAANEDTEYKNSSSDSLLHVHAWATITDRHGAAYPLHYLLRTRVWQCSPLKRGQLEDICGQALLVGGQLSLPNSHLHACMQASALQLGSVR